MDAVLAGGEIAQIGGAQNDGAVFKAVVGGVDQGIADAQSGELIDVVAKAEADALGAAAGPGAAGHGGSIDDGRGRGHGEGGIGVIAVGEVQVNAVVTLLKVVQIPVGQGHKALVHGVAAGVDVAAVHRQVITEVRRAAVRIEADVARGVLGVGAAGDADAARHGDIDGNGLGNVRKLGLDVDHGLIRRGRFGRGLDGQGAGLGAEHDVAGLDGLAVVGHETAGDAQRILAGGQGIGRTVDAHLGVCQAVAGHGVQGLHLKHGIGLAQRGALGEGQILHLHGEDRGVHGIQLKAGVGGDGLVAAQQDMGAVDGIVEIPAGKTLGGIAVFGGDGLAGRVGTAGDVVLIQRLEVHAEGVPAAEGADEGIVKNVVPAVLNVGDAVVAVQGDGGGGRAVGVGGGQGQRDAVVEAVAVEPGLGHVPAVGGRDAQIRAHQIAHAHVTGGAVELFVTHGDAVALVLQHVLVLRGDLSDGAALILGVDGVDQRLAAVDLALCEGRDREELHHESQYHEQAQESFSFQFHQNHLNDKRYRGNQPTAETVVSPVSTPSGTSLPWIT